MMATLRKYLIAGLLVWLPLAATVGIIKLVIDLLGKLILLLPVNYQPDTYIPGLGLLLAIGVLVLTGMLAANLLGRQFVSLWEAILSRIPIVRNIYNAVKQIASTVLTSQGKSFRKVVLVEYPRKGIWSIGFLTNEEVAFDCKDKQGNMVAVFLPTTPNPTSGFILMFSKEDLMELDMSVEEGFKFIISIGVVVPEGPIKESLLTTD